MSFVRKKEKVLNLGSELSFAKIIFVT